MSFNLELHKELDKQLLINKESYSVLVDGKYMENGLPLYKVINDKDRTMEVYEIENGEPKRVY